MTTRMTVDQLERMKTHELADLLGNIVMVLKRLPDVECRQLAQPLPTPDSSTEIKSPMLPTFTASFTPEELKKKTVSMLQEIAKELHIVLPTKILKADLISKILSKSTSGHSEQYAIQQL